MYNYSTLKNKLFDIHIFDFSKNTSDNDFSLFKKDFNTLLANKEKFMAVFNIINIESFNINFFYQKMNYIYSNKILVKNYLVASSIVVSEKYLKLIELGFVFKKPITPNFLTSQYSLGLQYLINTSIQKN